MGLLLPALFVVLKNLNFYLIIDSINTIIILHKKKNCNNLLQFFYETLYYLFHLLKHHCFIRF